MRKRFPKLPESPSASSLSTQASMKGNKSQGTMPEKKLLDALNSIGLTDYTVNEPGVPGTPDVVFRRQNVAVFVNGCYWHRCPYCRPNFPKSNLDYWTAKFQRNRHRDSQNRSELRAMGWRPLVVWECILLKNPRRVATRILRKLEEASG